MTIDTIKEHLPEKIKDDIGKYKKALLLDLYLQEKLRGTEDENLSAIFKDFIEIKEINKEEGIVTYTIDNTKKPEDISLDIEEARKAYMNASRTLRTTNNSFLVTSLIIFETAISELFKKIFTKYSEIYLNEEKIDASRVINAESMEELKEELINYKVSLMMRQNIFEWFKLLKYKQKINFDLDENSKRFIEGYYRRNIIVHNDGIANEEYLEKMKELGIDTSIKKGDTIDCSPTYVDNFIDASIYMIICILYNCLKLFNDETEGFLDEIQEYGVNLITAKKYELSTIIFKKVSEKDITNEQSMIYLKMNYWQSKKWNNKFEDVEKDVRLLDISAKDDYIKLGKYALLDDFDNMIAIVRNLSTNIESNAKLHYTVDSWPIFKEFKNSVQYKEFIEKENSIINTNKIIENSNHYNETQELIDEFE